MSNCPCGSNNDYDKCCKPLHKGKKKAETAEQLMRSRYCAYVMNEIDYILETSAPALRERLSKDETEKWAKNAQWQGLEIAETKDGGPDDDYGEVRFIARFREDGRDRTHHEHSFFEKEDGQWLYTDGKNMPVINRLEGKVGRNDPCTCGSGKKYKKCCG